MKNQYFGKKEKVPGAAETDGKEEIPVLRKGEKNRPEGRSEIIQSGMRIFRCPAQLAAGQGNAGLTKPADLL